MEPKEICKNIDKRVRPQAEVLVEQLQKMADKLIEEGNKMPAEKLIVDYDNGGGQSGVRENPYFPAYEKLLASYTKSIAAVQNLLGDNAPTETKSLDFIKSKFKVV